MAAPTAQQLNTISQAAKAAQDGYQALTELTAFLMLVQAKPSTPGIASADFTTPSSGKLQGFPNATFANFVAAAQAVQAAVAANGNALGNAFAAMAEWNS